MTVTSRLKDGLAVILDDSDLEAGLDDGLAVILDDGDLEAGLDDDPVSVVRTASGKLALFCLHLPDRAILTAHFGNRKTANPVMKVRVLPEERGAVHKAGRADGLDVEVAAANVAKEALALVVELAKLVVSQPRAPAHLPVIVTLLVVGIIHVHRN